MTMMSDEWRVQLTPLALIHDYDVRWMTGTANTTDTWLWCQMNDGYSSHHWHWYMTMMSDEWRVQLTPLIHDYDVRWMTGTANTTDTLLWCQMNDGYSSHHWHWYMTMMSDEWRVQLTPLIHDYDVRWMTGTANTTDTWLWCQMNDGYS